MQLAKVSCLHLCWLWQVVDHSQGWAIDNSPSKAKLSTINSAPMHKLEHNQNNV